MTNLVTKKMSVDGGVKIVSCDLATEQDNIDIEYKLLNIPHGDHIDVTGLANAKTLFFQIQQNYIQFLGSKNISPAMPTSTLPELSDTTAYTELVDTESLSALQAIIAQAEQAIDQACTIGDLATAADIQARVDYLNTLLADKQ